MCTWVSAQRWLTFSRLPINLLSYPSFRVSGAIISCMVRCSIPRRSDCAFIVIFRNFLVQILNNESTSINIKMTRDFWITVIVIKRRCNYRTLSGPTCLCTNVSCATRMTSARSGWWTTRNSWRDATWAAAGRGSMSRPPRPRNTRHSKGAAQHKRPSNESA